MKLRWSVAPMIVAAVALAGCDKAGSDNSAKPSAPVAAVAPPAGQQWTDIVAKTPQGGFIMGNPEAPVKLVEYASLTCPHCRDFTAAAAEPLRENYIKSGKVSWEFRPYVLNSLDVAATLLTRCQGPAPYFKLAEQVYADQGAWIGRFQALPEAEAQRIQALPPEQQFRALAGAAGLDGFFRARGLPQAKIDACLSDKAALDEIVKIRDLGTNQDKITGTPSFLINGELQESVYDWTLLEAKLREAVG
ncbi:protein-disulfide isomerase [Sphingomonas oleivorans]|uniref:Protein-disulfide isomerase n=1 Tax=Sphingomonas oleivorans TaxID=1735121 RepID=A0A2T5FXQ3_9SPHN|nr:thioredoxin domain-containing protein [Sphingomonas oleivorans]PTQ10918.1 protein-disulfide isomerase [Sphingomonas oleivorans]